MEGPKNGGKKKLQRSPAGVFWIVWSKCQNRLRELNIDRIQTFFAFFCLESNGVALTDFVNQTADVYEYFLAGGWVDHKTKTFGFVEELDSSCLHTKKIEKWKVIDPKDSKKVREFVENQRLWIRKGPSGTVKGLSSFSDICNIILQFQKPARYEYSYKD